MRKKNLLLATSLASVLLLAACGDDGKYEKLINKADKAMENLEVDQAIEHYEAILNLDPMSYKYGVSRAVIVEELLDNATYLKDRLEFLQSVVDGAKEVSEDVEFSVENAWGISDAYAVIQSALTELEDYPSTKMYKDVAALEKHFAKETEEKVVAPLLEVIEKNIAELKFDAAEEQVDALSNLADYNIGTITQEKIEEYYNVISTEKERYIVMPSTYVKREHVLYDAGEAGKITFLGESTSLKNDYLKVFYKVDGSLRHIVEELDLESRFILSDGTAKESDDFTSIDYGEYQILTQTISADEELSIVRYDYDLNVLQLEEFKSITLKTADGEGELPALLKLEAEKTVATDLKIEDTEKSIHIKNMIIDASYITLQGTITSKKDIDVEETSYLTLPGFSATSRSNYRDSLYAGVAKDFEMKYSMDEYLTTEMPYAHILLFDKTFNLDLKTGKEVAKVTSDIVDTISFTSVDGESTRYDYDEGLDYNKFYTDVAGKVYGNVTAVTQDSYYQENPEWYYQLNQKYATFKVDVGVYKENSSENFGSSKVTFLADGNVLKAVDLGANAATTTVELNVSNVEKLVVRVEMTRGNEDSQVILLGNGVMMAK